MRGARLLAVYSALGQFVPAAVRYRRAERPFCTVGGCMRGTLALDAFCVRVPPMHFAQGVADPRSSAMGSASDVYATAFTV